jgi:hypothetical protein
MPGMLEGVRESRRMPFLRRGMQIDMDGRKGRITGGNAYCNLQVRFDGCNYSSNVHPTWETTYYAEDGSVVADYKSEGHHKGSDREA